MRVTQLQLRNLPWIKYEGELIHPFFLTVSKVKGMHQGLPRALKRISFHK